LFVIARLSFEGAKILLKTGDKNPHNNLIWSSSLHYRQDQVRLTTLSPNMVQPP
jgi:hypothetical protein